MAQSVGSANCVWVYASLKIISGCLFEINDVCDPLNMLKMLFVEYLGLGGNN